MRRRGLRTVAATLLALAALAVSAWAHLSSTGAGSGSGDVSASRQVVVNAGAAPQGTLLPTGTSTGTLTLSVDNPNGSALRIGALALDTAEGTGGYDAEAVRCKVTYATQQGPWTVAADSTLQISLPGSLTMGTDAPSDCQGSTFEVYLKVSS